jgi:hypothetical protein
MITMLRTRPDLPARVGLGVSTVLPAFCSHVVVDTGRAAIAHLLRCLGIGPGSGVLVPAVVAEGVIQPLRWVGATPCFYRLGADLGPDPADVARCLDRHPDIRLMVIVSPCGFPIAMAPIVPLLTRFGVPLLIDCAQALASRDDAGNWMAAAGDFALYSLNKFLPVTDGAILLSHRPDVDVSLAGSALLPPSATTLAHYEAHLRLNAAILDSASPAEAGRLLDLTGAAYDRYYAGIMGDDGPRRISDESRAGMDTADLAWLISRRRRHADAILRHLNHPALRPLFNTLPTGVVPFAVPALVPSGCRPAVLAALWEQGVLLSTLSDRWDFVPPDAAGDFTWERTFLDRNVLIPVNEGLSDEQVTMMVTTMNQLPIGLGEPA